MMKKVRQQLLKQMVIAMGILMLLSLTLINAKAEELMLTREKAIQEISDYLENGVQISLTPGEIQKYEIPLSNGDMAILEVGCEEVKQTRGSDKYTAEYSSNGNYIFWGKINYSLIGSFQHRVNFTIRALSPTCKFSITSAAVEGQQPAPGLSNLNCGVTENVNYAVGTSAYSKAYASYSLAGVASNLYSKILLNSYSANKMEFTVYYSMSPIG